MKSALFILGSGAFNFLMGAEQYGNHNHSYFLPEGTAGLPAAASFAMAIIMIVGGLSMLRKA
jgi:hypothetical protein